MTFRPATLKHVGPPRTPQEIKRLRRGVGDLLRRHGQPVVHFHVWNLEDVSKGLAKKCPACFDPTYQNTRGDCDICFSMGFVSIEDSPDHWIDSRGHRTSVPGDLPAPRWGGFGEPQLTRVIEPDTSVDIFRINSQGVLVKTQNARGLAYWDPYMGDNDLVVNVKLATDGYTVNNAFDRYQLKMVNPITIRGWGRKGYDQSYTVNQEFEMNRIPSSNVLYQVPVSIDYGAI